MKPPVKGVLFMKGKSKCKILKDIRKQIAKENDIEFITSECKYQGDCLGTCPKCEAEVRYLEEELNKRQSAGKRIAVAGIAAAFALNAAGCEELLDLVNNGVTAGAPLAEISHETVDGEMPSVSQPVITDDSECDVTMGDIAPEESKALDSDEFAETGEVAEESIDWTDIMGGAG